MLEGKFIVIGVTGGIAAYKSLELVSLLKKKGAQVQIIMTKAACEFIRPLSFQTLSQNVVVIDMFKEPRAWEVEHIALADKADIFVVCPATANIIAKMAAGIADDMLTTTILATRAKVLVVPSMNVHMYENPITQRNIDNLKDFGFEVMEPAEGLLACGYIGKGRLPEPVEILERIEKTASRSEDLKDINVLITAGPTREPIDPVRFISNHSSGKMGYAIAERAISRGAKVTLVSGPVKLATPSGLAKYIQIETAADMLTAVLENFDAADIIIKAAAVADFTPAQRSTQKIKKHQNCTSLELMKTTDILSELGHRKTHQALIGFAAETQEIEKNAEDKLERKNLDFIIVNDVTKAGAGFGTDTNIVKVLHRNGQIEEFPLMLKSDIANIILDRALAYMKRSRGL